MNGRETLLKIRSVAKVFVEACDDLVALLDEQEPAPSAFKFAPALPTEPLAIARKVKAAAKTKNAKRSAGKAKRALPAAASVDEKPVRGFLRAAVMDLVKLKPVSSRELFEQVSKRGIQTTQDSVYQTCASLKSDGFMETRVTEGDGQRRWFLTGKAAV